jgi:hypothetical protein
MSTTRVVSKRTKALFIGFGAASIAAVCIVWAQPTQKAAAAASHLAPAATQTK